MTRPFAAAAWSLLLACAGSVQASDRPDPVDPAVAVPPVGYRSAFQDFRTHGDPAVGDWRAANDTVGRVGGWRTYAREVAEGAEAAEREAAAHRAGAAAPPRAVGPLPPAARSQPTPASSPADAHRHPGAGR